ncbi:MAG TPA: aldehyde dehydrogenase family protein [Streptosporangiaceae bacterium]|nr:aldehyde dehydrogenase family protein [Streptosporangiaceae bacterium]
MHPGQVDLHPFGVDDALAAGQLGGAGTVECQLEPHAAFGGFRQSGLGREGGRAAVKSYTEIKTVLLPFTDEMM